MRSFEAGRAYTRTELQDLLLAGGPHLDAMLDKLTARGCLKPQVVRRVPAEGGLMRVVCAPYERNVRWEAL